MDLDADVACKYARIRALPGHGLEYTIGNIQMWELLAARRRQLGDRFDLKAFHDDFIRRGRIPMALIRYEMLGDTGMEADRSLARTYRSEWPARYAFASGGGV